MVVVFVGGMSIIVPERVAKVVEIPQFHLVHLQISVGFKNQNLDFSGEIHPLFLRQVALQLG